MTGKKGRPRKKRKGHLPGQRHADLPRRRLRERGRRHLVHEEYTDDEDEEQQQRGPRKLRLVLKLPHSPGTRDGRSSVSPAPSYSSAASFESFVGEEEEDEEDEATKPLKKRRLGGRDESLGWVGSGHREERKANGVRRPTRSPSGVPHTSPRTPLPERKTLEQILDKLQKKDIYGVYAQPVDPEELPDYHEVIEHPMDFGTVRKKLAKGGYHSFEQFEDDVFLICSNAMQYNAPDTIYFRQAHAIQEMARKKFQSLRADCEREDVERKSEEKTRSSSIAKKPIKKSLSLTSPEPVISGVSSGPTLASAGDTCTVLNATQASVVERPVYVNGSVDGSSSLGESKSEKADEISAKCSLSKPGQKPFVVDENRRATYLIADQQPFDDLDLMFDIFKGEKQQLVAVGLDAEYSYARSLARFAGSLGPIAWRVASEKIEKALPAGVKFGPGWVGEFEPLPTPILSLENHVQQHRGYGSKLHCSVTPRKDKRMEEGTKVCQIGGPKDIHFGLRSHMITASSKRTSKTVMGRRTTEAKQGSDVTTEMRATKKGLSVITETRASTSNVVQRQPQESLVVDLIKPYTNSAVQVQPCNLPSINSVPFETAVRRPECSSEAATSKPPEMIAMSRNCEQRESPRWRDAMNSRNRNHQQSESIRQQEAVAPQSGNNAMKNVDGGLRNGNIIGKFNGNQLKAPLDFITNHTPQVENFFSPVASQVNVDNPFRLISSSGKMSNQSNTSDRETYSPKQVAPSIPQLAKESLSAAAVAARAWMSVGAPAEYKSVDSIDLINNRAGSALLYNNSTWETPTPALGVYEDTNVRPVSQAFLQPIQMASGESRFQDRGLVIFPQFVGVDPARFHGHSPLQSLVQHPQHRKDRDMLRPDLNITFQPAGSPVRSSSGLRMDSQQPDLALQL